MDKNGFFQIENKEDGTYINMYPKQGTGNMFTLEDVIFVADKMNLGTINVKGIKDAMLGLSDVVSIKLNDETTTPFAGWCEYTVINDGMLLTAKMFTPMMNQQPVSVNEIQRDLANMKVTYGIDNDAIEDMVKNNKFFQSIILAKGTEPIEGYDAELTYCFNTNIDTAPKMNEDGTVDFHKLDNINHVMKGDVVARIKPEDMGTPGKTIYGAVKPPQKVQRKSFKYTKNLVISEDGTELVTAISGHVSLDGDRVVVSDMYEVAGDVDTATGDIDYNGNVHIKGNVLAGFKVRASGDVSIDGVVEGATIEAGGKIILNRGIQGMNKGSLNAGGDIVAKFIENATARAGGYLETDAIMHSKVSARGEVNVHGRNGLITGGIVRAGSMITAKVIGSEMGTTTVVSVGIDPELVSSVEKLKVKITKAASDKNKLNMIVTMLRKKKDIEGSLDEEKLQLLQKSTRNMILLEQEIKKNRAQLENDEQMLKENLDARIKITGTLYPGVKLEFGDICQFIRDKNVFCQYVKQGVDIVRLNL